MLKPSLNILRLSNVPIFEQLQLEEALLRTDDRNWCLFNYGSSPAIVLGISGRPDLLINASLLHQKPIPLIRRFTGGGTVVVDDDTYFLTLICNHRDINLSSTPTPEKILRWTEYLYRPLFEKGHFQVKENDYVLGNRKFGGNAQYIRKDRWLQHSSLLWNFDRSKMEYLLMPPKVPSYRENRTHIDFLCCLNEHFSSKSDLEERIQSQLKTMFSIHDVSLNHVSEIQKGPHRKTTSFIHFQDLPIS